jgi:hypothetical protein
MRKQPTGQPKRAAARPSRRSPAPRPTHSPDGVDLTLIRSFLTLTPMERLVALENHRKFIQRIRDANPQL